MKVMIGSLTEKQMSEPIKIVKGVSPPPLIDPCAVPFGWFAITLPEYGIWLCFQDDVDKIEDLTDDMWSKSPEEMKALAKQHDDTTTWRIR